MLDSARAKLLAELPPDAVVLDVGGWADPFERADWVIDRLPYATRGLYERRGWIAPRDRRPERFTEATWIERDICDREPFPFDDDAIDFVICSQTLEDVRDPIWVCSEIERVGRAGYIETPSRLEEQSFGIAGAFAGWPHHHWLVEVDGERIEFVFKSHSIHSEAAYQFPREFWLGLSPEERVAALWWTGSFAYGERVVFDEGAETEDHLRDFVARELRARGIDPPVPGGARRPGVRERAARLLRRR